MKCFVPFAALIVAAALAACDYPAEFRTPVSEPGAVPYDERLLGTWYLVAGGDARALATILAVGRKGNGLLDITFVSSDLRLGGNSPDDREELRSEWIKWTAYPSLLDGNTYFNARIVDYGSRFQILGKPPETRRNPHFIAHPERGYWIAMANVDGDALLRLDIIWEGALRQEVRRNRIRCGEDCSFDVVDVSPEELGALIRSAEPGDLFKVRFVFARIMGVYPPENE